MLYLRWYSAHLFRLPALSRPESAPQAMLAHLPRAPMGQVVLLTEHATKHAHPERASRAEGSLLVACSSNFVHPYPTRLPSCQHLAPVTPLNATLVSYPVSVDYKRLTEKLNPLDATLTKNTGWGALPFTRAPSHSDWDPRVVGGNSRDADCRDVLWDP